MTVELTRVELEALLEALDVCWCEGWCSLEDKAFRELITKLEVPLDNLERLDE